MTLYFKVGTGPGVHCRVVRKRTPPVVGDVFKIVWRQREVQVRCCEIRDLGNEILYVVELF